MYDFYVKYKVFFSRLCLIQVIFSDQGLFHLHRFLYLFHVFILTLWTWSRLRRQARPKTTGVAGTCKHEIIILVASVSAHLVNARVVEQFF